MHVVEDEQKEQKMVSPKLIIFLDQDDIMPVTKELEECGVDPSKIQAKPLSIMILNAFQLKIEDYDGKVYYSQATVKFLKENREKYVDINRAQRRSNAQFMKRKLKRR